MIETQDGTIHIDCIFDGGDAVIQECYLTFRDCKITVLGISPLHYRIGSLVELRIPRSGRASIHWKRPEEL